MFLRKHRTSDVVTIKSRKKFLGEKESTNRLKHLRILIDYLPREELRFFFIENSSYIFYTFSDGYFNLETEVKQRGNSGIAKDLEALLLIFEEILILLPELVHQRWQYNCIIEILQELLNEKNLLVLRVEALRLFLIWYQILGSNATKICHQLFNHLVPEFGSLITEYQKSLDIHSEHRGRSQNSPTSAPKIEANSNAPKSVHYIYPRDSTALLPYSIVNSDTHEDDTRLLLRYLLRFSVTEASKVEWIELRHDQQLMQLWFLFEQLKRSYLPVLFPCLSPFYSIYLPQSIPLEDDVDLTSKLNTYPIPLAKLSIYQEDVIRWLTVFIFTGTNLHNARVSSVDSGMRLPDGLDNLSKYSASVLEGGGDVDDVANRNMVAADLGLSTQTKSTNGSANAGSSQGSSVQNPSIRRDAEMREDYNKMLGSISTPSRESVSYLIQQMNLQKSRNYASSNNALRESHRIKRSQRAFLVPGNYTSEMFFDYKEELVVMVREVLYGCRQNINLIQDILHQTFLIPIQRYKSSVYAIKVYRSWLLNKQSRPIFMQPVDTRLLQTRPKRSRSYNPLEDRGHEGDDEEDDIRGVSTKHGIQGRNLSGHTTSVRSTPVVTGVQSDSDLSPRSSIGATHTTLIATSTTTTVVASSGNRQSVTVQDRRFLSEELRGCLQSAIQVMLQNMANVFLSPAPVGTQTTPNGPSMTPPKIDTLKQQVNICHFILQIFQDASNSNELTPQTWCKLLSILMGIMRKTMVDTSPTDTRGYQWLSDDKLTQALFQTLNGALLRASLFSSVSSEPWDDCLNIYSQLTHWPSLIIEWRKVMSILTTTMAKLVYGVQLTNLPQEKKGRRGKRLEGHASSRMRPKSFTESATNYRQSAALLSPTAISPSNLTVLNNFTGSVDTNLASGPVNDPKSRNPALDARRNGPQRYSHGSPSIDEWALEAIGDSEVLNGPLKNVDQRVLDVPDEEDSASLDLNGTLGVELDGEVDMNRAPKSRPHSHVLVRNSKHGGSHSDAKDATLVSGHHLESRAVRRVASEVTFKRKKHSSHKRTSDYDRNGEQTSDSEQSRKHHGIRRHKSAVSLDGLSALSTETDADPNLRPLDLSIPTESHKHTKRHHKHRHSSHPMTPTSPSTVLSGADDDSLSMSQHDFTNSSCASTEEVLDGNKPVAADFRSRRRRSISEPSPPNPNIAQIHLPSRQFSHHPKRFVTWVLPNRAWQPSPPTLPPRPNGTMPEPSVLNVDAIDIHRNSTVSDPVAQAALIIRRRDTLTAADNHSFSDVRVRSTSPKSPLQSLDQALLPLGQLRCILAGGTARGFTYESVIVCWRRFLGLLGNFNRTCSPSMLTEIYNYMAEMTTSLIKIREYQLMDPVTNTCVQPVPNLVPPIDFIAPTLFDALDLSDKYIDAKVLVLRILNDIMLRSHDGSPNSDLVAYFYRTLHQYLNGSEDKYVCEVVRSCNSRLFVSSLPSSNLLLLSLVSGASKVLSHPNSGPEIPRSESLAVINNLLCYPHHYGCFDCLDPASVEPRMVICTNLKSRLIRQLIQTTLTDPNAEARCLALTGLTIHCIHQILCPTTHFNDHISKPNQDSYDYVLDAFVVLLGMMRFRDRSVGLVATEMILLLADYCEPIHNRNPKLPLLVISSLVWTLQFICKVENSEKISMIDKRLYIGIMHAITEWCVRLPSSYLLTKWDDNSNSSSESSQTLLNVLLDVLCLIINRTSSLSNSEQSTINDLGLSDPIDQVVSLCKYSIDSTIFTAAGGQLDLSSLAIKSWLMNGMGHPWSGFQLGDDSARSMETICLTSRVTICHLLNHLDHFPLVKQCAQLNTSVQEHFDQSDAISDLTTSKEEDEKELSAAIFERSNLQLFVLDKSILISFLALPALTAPESRLTSKSYLEASVSELKEMNGPWQSDPQELLVTDRFYVRTIIRDLSGKYSWDASCLYGFAAPRTKKFHFSQTHSSSHSPTRSTPPCPPPRLNPNPPPLNSGTSQVSSPPDRLNGLLRELTSSSPECLISWGPPAPGDNGSPDVNSSPNIACSNLETMTTDQITSQCHTDMEVTKNKSDSDHANSMNTDIFLRNSNTVEDGTYSGSDAFVHFENFGIPRHLLNQLGYFSWERRPTVELLQKSAGLVRELKHLDNLGTRETHKVAVFYIAAGQEDKQAILSNQTGSLEYENFVAGLGWEVDLVSHRGFRGGLERSGRAGPTTPYYGTSTLEVIFHVSTRMPSSTQEDLKYKHLGNDEVMIIWNENARTFRRSALPTQFGDVLIIISPLLNGLFRVEVRRESEVGFFGPIVDTAILNAKILPGLVRATAINASRAIRAMKPGYKHHYEDRAAILQQIVSKYTLPSCFEDFSQSILAPGFSLESSAASLVTSFAGLDPTESAIANASYRDDKSSFAALPIVPTNFVHTQSALSTSRSGPVAKALNPQSNRQSQRYSFSMQPSLRPERPTSLSARRAASLLIPSELAATSPSSAPTDEHSNVHNKLKKRFFRRTFHIRRSRGDRHNHDVITNTGSISPTLSAITPPLFPMP